MFIWNAHIISFKMIPNNGVKLVQEKRNMAVNSGNVPVRHAGKTYVGRILKALYHIQPHILYIFEFPEARAFRIIQIDRSYANFGKISVLKNPNHEL